MKQKILPIVIGVLFIALIGNNYRMYQQTKKDDNQSSDELKQIQTLMDEKESWSKRERQLLDDNAYLITELNLLKAEIELKPKTIIKYKKYEKANNVNESASDNYNELLTRRYDLE